MNTPESRLPVDAPDGDQLDAAIRVSIALAGAALALAAGYLIGLQRGGTPGGLAGAVICPVVFLGSYFTLGARP